MINNIKIEKKFKESQDSLVIQSSDLSLDSIANMVEGDAINIKPRYQRRARWSVDKQSALIESFLLNVPVPPVYLAEDEYGKYSVIDGKQRITAISNFISNSFKLLNLEKFVEIEGLTFDMLPSSLKNALKIRPYVRVITLLKQSDPSLKYDVFNRLNTGGDNLLPQEIRNAAFEGAFNDSLIELSTSRFLAKQFRTDKLKLKEKSTFYKQMLDVEFVLRFFTLRENWHDFNGNMKKSMDQFMQKNKAISYDDIEKNKNIFLETLNLCEKIFEDSAFRRPDSGVKILQGIYDVQMVPVSFFLSKKDILLKKHKEIRNEFVDKYSKDIQFQKSIRQFTSNKDQVKKRIETMMDIIKNIISNE